MVTRMTKICCKCRIEQPIENFARNKKCKNGRTTVCKPCFKISYKEWLKRDGNFEKLQQKNKIKRSKQKKKTADYDKQRRQKFKEKNILRTNEEIFDKTLKKCYCCKKEKLRLKENWTKHISKKDALSDLCKSCMNAKVKIKFYNDIIFRLKLNLRRRLGNVLNRKEKIGSAVFNLGCDGQYLIKYLESMFYPNSLTGEMMSWDNYGVHGWHIDHIKPLSIFDLTNKKQFLEACHYTNLQPLWAQENLFKRNKYRETN